MSLQLDIGEVVGLAGAVATSPEAVRVGPAHLERVGVDAIRLQGARAAIAASGTLTGAEVDLTINRGGRTPPVDGRVAAAAIEASRLTIELAERRASADARLEGAVVTLAAGGGSVAAQSATLTNIQVGLGALVLRADAVELEQPHATWGPDGVRLQAHAARARQVTLIGERLELVIDELALPDGVSFGSDGLRIPGLTAAAARTQIELASPGEAKPAASAAGAGVDLRILDLLGGHLNVDLFVDVRLPVIGHRRATHRFRLGIEHGTIDFNKLESGLSGLEDAFLDIELEGDAIVLERDIPLVPGDAKPILVWKLDDAVELALARENRVRLRRLTHFEVAGRKHASRGDDSPSALRRLELREIDAELSLSPASAVIDPDAAAQQLQGWLERASIEIVHVTGTVGHAPDERPPGTLSISGRAIEAAVAGVAAGRAIVERAEVRVDALESGALGFAGLRPNRVQARARGLSVHNLQLRLG